MEESPHSNVPTFSRWLEAVVATKGGGGNSLLMPVMLEWDVRQAGVQCLLWAAHNLDMILRLFDPALIGFVNISLNSASKEMKCVRSTQQNHKHSESVLTRKLLVHESEMGKKILLVANKRSQRHRLYGYTRDGLALIFTRSWTITCFSLKHQTFLK
jgi:hypothetical protein